MSSVFGILQLLFPHERESDVMLFDPSCDHKTVLKVSLILIYILVGAITVTPGASISFSIPLIAPFGYVSTYHTTRFFE